MESAVLESIFNLVKSLGERWEVFAGVFARMGAIAFLAPAMGELSVSPRVRLAAAAALTAVIAPGLVAPAGAGEPATFIAILAAEASAGLLIGFILRLAIFILQMLGAIAAQSLSMTQLFGPGLGHDQESPISTIFIAAGLALACASGLHIQIAAAAAQTYALIPLGGLFDVGDAAGFVAKESAKAISLAFGIAAPFVLLGMAYSAALAASNRTMPQMAAVFVGAPAIALAGLTLIAGAAWAILSRWTDIASVLFSAPLGGLP